ncbi:MAG: GNAT family N-acetyltransferase [Candidatus Nanoarchaeia archaeon]
MKIRQAKQEDKAEYIKMRKSSMASLSKISKEKIALSKKDIEKEFDKLIKKKDVFIFLMVEGKNVVGYINILYIVNKKYLYLNDLFVKESFRSKGYGKMLMDKFIGFSKEKNVKTIGLSVRAQNKKAIKMYERYGFKIIGLNMERKLK